MKCTLQAKGARVWRATRMAHGRTASDGAQARPSARILAAQAQPETRVTPESRGTALSAGP